MDDKDKQKLDVYEQMLKKHEARKQSSDQSVEVYQGIQAFLCGTFGSVFAPVYCAYANHKVMRPEKSANSFLAVNLAIACIGIIALMFVIGSLRLGLPNIGLMFLVNVILATGYAAYIQNYQVKYFELKKFKQYRYQNNWKVVALWLLGLLALRVYLQAFMFFVKLLR